MVKTATVKRSDGVQTNDQLLVGWLTSLQRWGKVYYKLRQTTVIPSIEAVNKQEGVSRHGE